MTLTGYAKIQKTVVDIPPVQKFMAVFDKDVYSTPQFLNTLYEPHQKMKFKLKTIVGKSHINQVFGDMAHSLRAT